MTRRVRPERGAEAVTVVDDTLPVVLIRAARNAPATRSSALLQLASERAHTIAPARPGPVTAGARAFTPCGYDGQPLDVPPVTLDVVALGGLPLGSVVLAPVNVGPSGAWARVVVVGNATQVRPDLAGGDPEGLVALGRRVTSLPVADVQGAAGAAIFAGARASAATGFLFRPLVALDAFLPSGRVQFRGADGTTFEAPGLGMLASVELPLPDQAGRVWIIEAADRATTDPDPDAGAAFVCVNPVLLT